VHSSNNTASYKLAVIILATCCVEFLAPRCLVHCSHVVKLHVHLDGSMRPTTFLELLPSIDDEQVGNQSHGEHSSARFTAPEDIEVVAHALFAHAAVRLLGPSSLR